MKVGLVVDGQGEYYALPHLLAGSELRRVVLRPIVCDLPPKAAPGLIAYKACKGVNILAARGASSVVVLLDKEDRKECAPQLAELIQSEIRSRMRHAKRPVNVTVVMKVNKFENWLIADPKGLLGLRGRFERRRVTAIAKKVVPNKADKLNALRLLKIALIDRSYDKVQDAVAISKKVELSRAAANSRSLRRFLRTLGHPRYRKQSKLPIAETA